MNRVKKDVNTSQTYQLAEEYWKLLSLTRVPPQPTWPKLTCGSYVQSRATGNVFMQLLCATNAEFIRIISLQILSIIVGGFSQ